MNKLLKFIFSFVVVITITIPYSCSIKNNKKQDEFIVRQWYIKNDGVCKGMTINPDFCQNTKLKKGIDINIMPIWSKQFETKREVVVAIIDTGINFLHEDLKDKVWINKEEIPGDNIDNDNNGFIDDIYGWNFCNNDNDLMSGEELYENDHGTMEAGIIAARHNSIGIAGNCNVKIMNIKILYGIAHKGNIKNLIKGIKYAEKMGADICNLSIGFTERSKELEKIISVSPMLFVVSAGNNGIDIDEKKQYPASYLLDNLITVANMEFDGKLDTSSNYGEKTVDTAAPGTNLFSTCVDGYDYATGTSMATAVVTGVASLLYSSSENATPQNVKTAICNNVSFVNEFDGLIRSKGYINANKALNFLLNYKS